MRRLNVRHLSLLVVSAITFTSFQNCSPGFSAAENFTFESSSVNEETAVTGTQISEPAIAPTPTPNPPNNQTPTPPVVVVPEPPAPEPTTSIPLPRSLNVSRLDHRAAVILAGSNFGSRSVPVSRVLFDDASGNNVLDKWDFSCNNTADVNYRMAYRSPDQIVKANGVVGGVPTPHARISKYISGAPYTAGGASWNVCLGKNNQQDQQRTYINVYTRIDPSFHFNCTQAGGSDYNCDRNYKEYDWAAGAGYMGRSGQNIYNSVMWAGTGNSSVSWGFNNGEFDCPSSGGSCRNMYPIERLLNLNVHEYYPEYRTAPSKIRTPGPISGWIKLEYVLIHNSATGLQRFLVNNVLTTDMSIDNRPTNFTDPTSRSETVIGGYHRDAGASELYKNNFRYYSQVYYDRSFARAVLVNNADYNRATIVEPQILTSWSSSQISFQTNLGMLPANSTAYLFVFNENGQRSASGVPVTIGN